MIKAITKKILHYFILSPFYPHWLTDFKLKQGDQYILKGIHGSVLEVGAGDGSRKAELMKKHPAIREYLSTDYSTWDNAFQKYTELSKKSKGLSDILFGIQKRVPIDLVCSATQLPFPDEKFDFHLSFNVLEHINEPNKYFLEAIRVIKKGGKIILSAPFLYRIHGLEPDHHEDYFRYANGFFHYMAKKHKLKIVKIFNNTGLGTTMATTINQYLIRRIVESNIFLKFIYLFFSPIVFFLTNILGFLIDLKPDKRFTTMFHVILQKK